MSTRTHFQQNRSIIKVAWRMHPNPGPKPRVGPAYRCIGIGCHACSSLWGERAAGLSGVLLQPMGRADRPGIQFRPVLLAPVTRLQLGMGWGGSNQNTMHFGQFFIIEGQKYEISKIGCGYLSRPGYLSFPLAGSPQSTLVPRTKEPSVCALSNRRSP